MRDWERISELVPHSYGWIPVWYMCSYMCAGLLDKAGNSYATSSQASMAWVPERGYSESKAVEQPGHMGACLWCPHHVWEMSLADPPRCQQSSILGNEGLLPLSGFIFPSLCHDTIVQILSPPPSPWSDLRNGLDIGSLMMLESPSAQTCSLSSHVVSWLLFFSWNPPEVLPVPSQARIKTSNIQKPLALKHLWHFRFSSISIHVGWETIHSVTVVWCCHCQLFYGSCKILIKWMKYTIWGRWSIPRPPTELAVLLILPSLSWVSGQTKYTWPVASHPAVKPQIGSPLCCTHLLDSLVSCCVCLAHTLDWQKILEMIFLLD